MRSFPALLLVAALALVAEGCGGGARLGPGASGRRQQTIRVAASPDEAYQAATQLATEWGWEVGFYDDQQRIFLAAAPGNMHREDDELEVTVGRSAAGSNITIRSEV